MEQPNWNVIEEKIKNCEFPLAFIFNLLKSSEEITDSQLSNIIRFFFKHHYDIAIYNKIFELLPLIDDNYYISKQVIKDFYILLKKKYLIILSLEKFNKAYKKFPFWIKDTNYQIKYLEETRKKFYALFDLSYGTIPIFVRMSSCLDNNYHVINNIMERIHKVYKLFRHRFFIEYDILLLTSHQLLNLSAEGKVKYCLYIYYKINKILNSIINTFEIYQTINNQLNSLVNPKPIKFIIDNVQSETDMEDLMFYMDI